MKVWVCFFLVTIIFVSKLVAQPEPYYKDLSNRDLEDMEFLPNLSTSKTRLYLSGNFAFRSQGPGKLSGGSERFEVLATSSFDYGGTMGVSIKDNWYYDLGFSANPMYMRTSLSATTNGQDGISLNSGANFTSWLFTVRKKVWQLDKVTKNAALLFTVGLRYSPDLASSEEALFDRQYRFRLNRFNAPPDTASFRISTFSDTGVFTPEVGLEVSGKIVEQVEVGLFFKVGYWSKGTLYNTLSYRLNSQEEQLTRQNIGSFPVDFGFMLRWNMINWMNYKSDVE